MTIASNENPQHDIELFIDGHCAHCRRFGKIVARLDGKRRIRISSFRHEQLYQRRGLTETALTKRMHLHSRASGRTVAGFQAVRELCRALSLLRPLLAPLWLLARLGIGDRLYDLLARHRIIVPSSQACLSGSCPIDH
jgi:predicted DCC family thiol-disulfide oxidoreductase YuxK